MTRAGTVALDTDPLELELTLALEAEYTAPKRRDTARTIDKTWQSEGGLRDLESQHEQKHSRKRRRTDVFQQREARVNAACGAFSSLPSELVLQVLASSSAADLVSVARTSSFFREAASDNSLWRPFYVVRFGTQVEDSTKLHDTHGWKEKYMEKDATEVSEISERVPSTMQELYLQMATAKRTLAVPRSYVIAPLSDVALKGRISRWRGARGLTHCPSPLLGTEHKECRQKGPYAALPGCLYMCESCGWAHLCGETCTEKFYDAQAEQLVCPISGRCFDVIVEDSYDDARDGMDDQGAYDFGTAGHWGRAYADGYNCGSEAELRRNCGACL